jgi:hypothetical protein
VTKGCHVGIKCDGGYKKCDYVSVKLAIINVCGTGTYGKELPDEFFLVLCMW